MCDLCDTQNDDIRDKTDHGNGQPEYGQQYINDSLSGTGDGVDATVTAGPSDPSAAAAVTKGGSTALSATLGVGIKEYMNVPWMPLVDIDTEPTGNSLDPSVDRREQSGRGFTNAGAGRTGYSGGGGNRTTATRPAGSPAPEDDQFPYDEVVKSNGTATGDIREPVLRPKSRIRMYRMPDGSEAPAAAASNGVPTLLQQLPSSSSPLVNGSSALPSPSTATVERSFIVHLLPQKLMNIIEQAERYARMAFSPFMSTTKERAQRALKNFPRLVLSLGL